ncbi:MAG: hypothetical protein JW763_10300 [candidate division Zixibacteria bacterium]|nr:hypothetical protein [candidate division Zixibacteria bacterium]
MKLARITLMVLMILGLATIAGADVVVKSKITTNILAAGSTEVSHTEYMKTDRSYGESTTKMTGGMMAMMGNKEQQSIDITRLDKELIWTLNPEQKSYREMTFEQLKAAFANKPKTGTAAMGGGDPEKYAWEIKVDEMPAGEKVGGYACNGMIATAKGIGKDDPEDVVVVTYKMWYSDKFPGFKTYKAFQGMFADKLGSDQFGEQRRLANMLSMFGDKLDVLMDKMQAIEGMPMKSVMLVERSKAPYQPEEGEQEDPMKAQMRAILGEPEKTESGMYKIFSIQSEVTGIEETSFDEGKFNLPEGYSSN